MSLIQAISAFMPVGVKYAEVPTNNANQNVLTRDNCTGAFSPLFKAASDIMNAANATPII